MDTSSLHRTFHCWNQPLVVEAGKFVHLTARAVWIDGRVIVTAVKVADTKIVELPEVKCEACLDAGWLIVVVHGPAEIPARARISVRMQAEVACAKWLTEIMPNPSDDLPALVTKAKALRILESGELL